MNGEIGIAEPGGVGALLKASRERLGEDVHAVSRALRIRQRYLQDIEDGAYDDLPGPTYAVGFVRAYAEYVGLDGDEVVRRFKAETSALNGAAELRFPSPVSESGIPGGAVVLIGLLIAGLAYGAWYAVSDREGFVAELISPLPDRFGALVASDRDDPAVPRADAPTDAPPRDVVPEPPIAKPPAAIEAVPAVQPDTDQAPPPGTPADVAAYPPPPRPGAGIAPSSRAVDGGAEGDGTAVGGGDESDGVPQGPSGRADVPPAGGEDDVARVDPPPPMTADEPFQTPDTGPETAAADLSPVPAIDSGVLEPQRVSPPVEADEPAGDAATTENSEDQDDNRVTAAVATEAPAPASAASEADTAETPPAGRVFGDDEDVRIVVRARIDSWIQVRDDRANRMLVTRLLRAGDVYRVPDRPGLQLSTGDAGALEILVDGERVPPIGGKGKVRRSVALDADRLRRGAAVSE